MTTGDVNLCVSHIVLLLDGAVLDHLMVVILMESFRHVISLSCKSMFNPSVCSLDGIYADFSPPSFFFLRFYLFFPPPLFIYFSLLIPERGEEGEKVRERNINRLSITQVPLGE